MGHGTQSRRASPGRWICWQQTRDPPDALSSCYTPDSSSWVTSTTRGDSNPYPPTHMLSGTWTRCNRSGLFDLGEAVPVPGPTLCGVETAALGVSHNAVPKPEDGMEAGGHPIVQTVCGRVHESTIIRKSVLMTSLISFLHSTRRCRDSF